VVKPKGIEGSMRYEIEIRGEEIRFRRAFGREEKEKEKKKNKKVKTKNSS